MTKALLKSKSSLFPGPTIDPSNLSKTASNPDNAAGPGSTNIARPFIIAGAGTPSSSNPASAPICTCGQVIATSPGYIDEDGEEHDVEYYYHHCELHDPGKKDYWSISSLGDLMKLTNTTLTKEGRAFWKQLRRESDERNPYIAEMEVVKREIQDVDDELNFMGVAKEKIKEWHQQDQFDRAAGRERVAFPEWLERYRDIEKFYDAYRRLETKRQELCDKKLEIHTQIVSWRYGLETRGDKS